jgi:hypothetical protein
MLISTNLSRDYLNTSDHTSHDSKFSLGTFIQGVKLLSYYIYQYQLDSSVWVPITAQVDPVLISVCENLLSSSDISVFFGFVCPYREL